MAYFEIRNAEKTDLPRFAEIEAECIPTPWSIRAFESEFAAKGAIFLAADSGNGICAFLTASSVLDEVNINNVAVTVPFRRKGFGEALMNALEERVSSFAAAINLEVRESNVPAILLYEKLGYEQVGVRKGFYSNPTENALLMTKRIKQKEDSL
ncbi:MAG: ribosomal protein S18-alanine N-acetyltransferase [Oscillospiraceae bacterium]|nr:ribosomal protein S18-alanine N-acetyltransferase [Oscillospiraceae bacterium]